MKVIRNENIKAMARSAVFLAAFGLLIALVGYSAKNNATLFIGISFSLLSYVCLLFIRNDNSLTAKILWGLGTPLLLFISPLLFSLSQPTAIFTYGYMYSGGAIYISYSFQEKSEQKYKWISLGLFFFGILFYDKIIIDENFKHYEHIAFYLDYYVHFKFVQLMSFFALNYLISIIHKNKWQIETKLKEQITKLKFFTSSMIDSSKNKLIHSGNLKDAQEEILRNTATVMGISRISIWEIDEEVNSLKMTMAYDSINKEFSYSGELDCKKYPNYLKHLLDEKIIIANDVLTDFKTIEFADTYTIPFGIKSMMDTPYFIDGKFKGILCCEEQRYHKEWDDMDQLFSMSVSKLISIAQYCSIRKEQFSTLRKTSKELGLQNTKMEGVNQKILKINGELTNDLYSKEEGIKELKKFMDEVSFKNAHELRGPLSRILGLLDLYKTDTDTLNRDKYISYLDKSAKELDEIIKEISVLLGKTTFNN